MARKRRQNAAKDGWSLTRKLGAVLGACGRIAVLVLPLILILAAAASGIAALWSAALRDPRFIIAGDTLSLLDAARFCEEARHEVHRLGRKAAGRSLLDPWLLTDLRREYERSPWVKRVCRLSRVFPDRVAVEFVLRVPLAQVRAHGWYWQVDRDGVLLRVPGRESPHVDLPEIVGTVYGTIPRQPAYGQVWRDQGVQDALGILNVIAQSPVSEDIHVRRVLVHRGSFLDTLERRHRKRPRIDLQTEEGILIRWGTYNCGDLPGELRTTEKMAMLRGLLSREFAVPGICLDVRTRVPGYSMP